MQSAAGSLRGPGPSRSVSAGGDATLWGIGADGFALSGHYIFRLIRGAVTICGITLSLPAAAGDGVNDVDSSPWYAVSSPVAPFPSFSAAHSLSSYASVDLPEELTDYGSIIEVRPSSTTVNVSDLAPPYKSLWHNLQRIENSKQPLIQIPSSWAKVLSTRGRRERQFLVLGPKNSGKSSFARYLCNKLLQNPSQSKVFYLELDPGQPEFTPPGCLTLHTVSDFNFSPAFAHSDFRSAVKSHNLGYASPMDTPRRYLDMCNDLLHTYYKLASSTDFLVVNTPGWTKGLGLDLNTEIANMLSPAETSIVHMGPSDFNLDLEEVETADQNGADPNPSMSTITASGFSAAELRALQIITYFHQNTADHLTTWPPYELKIGTGLGAIHGIAVLDSTGVNLSQDLKICVEGTLVSINIANNESVEDLSAAVLFDDEANNIWERSMCVGMAVVQCISEDLRSIRLLTPLDPRTLDLNNHKVILVRGRIQLPVWELYNREFPNSPWISTARAVGTGATYTKFRRNIRRN